MLRELGLLPIGTKEVTIEPYEATCDSILEWLSDYSDIDPWCNDVADILLDMNTDEADSVAPLIIGLTPELAYEKLIEITGALYRPHYIQCRHP